MENILNNTNEAHPRSPRWFVLPALTLSLLLVLDHNTWAADADPAAARFRGAGKADPIRIADIKKATGPAGQSAITFDLAWDHSWRATWDVPEQAHGGKGTLKLEGWDAAWVFVKFRKAGTNFWSQATLSAQAADHVTPAAAKLDVGSTDDGAKGAGVFIYRATAGSGPNDWKGLKLLWLSEADGVTDLGATEVKVFAIQMVYVPECAFWLGDGSTAQVAAQFSVGDTAASFRVESEDEITLGGENPKHLGSRDGIGVELRGDDFSSGVQKTLPARFPKGYAAFYCMRHELTEGQFVDYLNTLPSTDRLPPPIFKGNSAGPGWILPFQEKDITYNGISVVTPGTPDAPAAYATATPFKPCTGLVSYEHTRYATWAGLRPMTELEYEKSCRGPLRPVADEFAWGTPAIVGSNISKKDAAPPDGYVVTDAGKPDERVSWKGVNGPDATRGNAVWGGAVRKEAKGGLPADALKQNLRGGIFATPQSDRVAAGASYWGIMDLSGNLEDRVVTVGSIPGRRFAGTHGAWPVPFATIGEGAELRTPEDWGWGFGRRGGTLSEVDSAELRTSDRQSMNATSHLLPARNRHSNQGVGFRGVRTAKIVPYELKPQERVVATPISEKGGRVLRNSPNGWNNECAVVLGNVTVAARDAKTATIAFDVSWRDSWRTSNNHDAAWVFFKAKTGDSAAWQHVKLVADRVVNPTGYGQADGGTKVELIVPDGPDGFTGVFVRRAAPGEGTLEARRVTVLCDADTVKGIAADSKDLIRAIGIQMVYVPEGAFSLGTGGTEVGSFHQYTDGVDRSMPYRVTGSGPIPTGKKQGQLWAGNHGGPLVDGGQIPAAFPNGYAHFYCMKYLISPAQYADFLNTIDPKQADERYAGHERCAFNTVVYSGTNGRVLKDPKGGYSSAPGGARGGAGCFGLSWADGATFAAWAGLRPMTELELEKAVRGPRDPFPGEVGCSYWGVAALNNVDWNAFKGAPQCERPVTASAPGLRFKGTHGAGTISLPADWPQADAVGSGVRCTHYSSYNLERLRGAVEQPGFFQPKSITSFELPRARLSDRLFAGVADPERLWSHKWRGVRTAPKGVGP